MKHNLKITLILLSMFFITQLIGLAVINAYSSPGTELPYGMQPPEISPGMSLTSIIIAMAIAIFLILLLMKIKGVWILRIWFFVVVTIAISITLNSAILRIQYSSFLALIISLPLAFYKIFRRNFIVHNFTELLVYPGIAAVFVPILSIWSIILLLLLISIYDVYAVWHSGFMQKMAKFQMEKVKVFAGFFVPYLGKKERKRIQLLRQKYKNSKQKFKNKKVKVNIAILGGGDVVFPMILAGVVLKTLGLGLLPALTVSLFATLSLLLLFFKAKKGKFYPAMPFITAGCLVGLILGWRVF